MWQASLDDMLNNPPIEMPLMIDFFGNEIYEGESFYDINGTILSEDGLESAKIFTTDEDNLKCALDGEEINENTQDFYYLINGEVFCDKCVRDCKETAERWDG